MLKIRILKGVKKGEVESVTNFIEKEDTGIYVSHTGANYDMKNNGITFVLEEDINDINLAEFGDADLLQVMKKQQQIKEPEKKEPPQPTNNDEGLKGRSSSVDDFIGGLITRSKKTKKKLSLSVEVQLPTKDFKKLIDSSFDVEEDDFLQSIYEQLEIDTESAIKKAIAEFYKKTTQQTT